MPKEFTIRAVAEFSAAHRLKGYPGACERVHGHNWRVEVEAVATDLDPVGMGIDFVELQRELDVIAQELDHRLLNDTAPFSDVNPTAENVASFFLERLKARLPQIPRGDAVGLRGVTVSENSRSSVTVRDVP